MPIFRFISRRIESVRYALNGVYLIIKTQHNAWIHAMMTAIVVALGLIFNVSLSDWKFLILAMMSVWIAEALNTALECLADGFCKEYHPLIGRAKDVAAGAVLIAATGATIVGCIIFLPKIAEVLR